MTHQDFVNLHFINYFEAMQTSVHNTANSKGWHDESRKDGEFIALMHSELSEGLEALRTDAKSDKLPDYKGIEEELADTIIRIMDYAELKGLKLARAIVAKAEYNTTRSHRHGGKKF